jgi:hypothetical protein
MHQLLEAPPGESLQVKGRVFPNQNATSEVFAESQVEIILQRLFERSADEEHAAGPQQLRRAPYEKLRLAHVLEHILRDDYIERLGFERGRLEQFATEVEIQLAPTEFRHLRVQLDPDHVVPRATGLIEEESAGRADFEEA